jgi:protoheme IX farnesyltransferase
VALNVDSQEMTGHDSPPPETRLRDFLILTKPVIVALQLLTTLAAMVVGAAGWPGVRIVFWTLLGGALTAGGASALNHYVDRDLDRLMRRTRARPLPAERMDRREALVFGILLCVLGVTSLAFFVNLLSALLALAGVLYYVVFYSMILKPTTAQNIVVGGGAGCFPPLVGWAAATGGLSVAALFLAAVVFFWTPPHFWAMALVRRRDYARAGIPMMPVVYGDREARWMILLYSVQVVALTFLLPIVHLGQWLFVAAAMVLGAVLIFRAYHVLKDKDSRVTWRMYRFSNTYLALVFAALVLDTLL